MIRNAHKSADSRGGSSALSAQYCIESTLGMTQSSDSTIDQVMNSQQTQSNRTLAGIPSTRSTLTTPTETSSPKGGSSATSSATHSLTYENIYDTIIDASPSQGGGASVSEGPASGGVSGGSGTAGSSLPPHSYQGLGHIYI